MPHFPLTLQRQLHRWRCMLGSLSVVPPALPKSGFPPEGHSNTCSLKSGTPSPPGWLGMKQGHEVWVLGVPVSLLPHVLAVAARSHPCCPRGWDGLGWKGQLCTEAAHTYPGLTQVLYLPLVIVRVYRGAGFQVTCWGHLHAALGRPQLCCSLIQRANSDTVVKLYAEL